MIVDAHAHVWPDDIAPKVLAGRPAGMDSRHDGTLAGLTASMDAAGIARALTLAVASVPKNVARTNEFIGTVDRSRFVPFGTVHPELSDEENLHHLRDNGIQGVKLHPLYQDVTLGHPRTIDLMTALAEADVVVITHAGSGGRPGGERARRSRAAAPAGRRRPPIAPDRLPLRRLPPSR